MDAIVIGGIAGVLCYFAVRIRARSGLDDSLDVVGVHGVGGMWGGIATGIFAAASSAASTGWRTATPARWSTSSSASAPSAIYSFVVTCIILKVLDLTIGIRVSEDDEELGLDVTQHGERGYVFDEAVGVPVYQSPR